MQQNIGFAVANQVTPTEKMGTYGLSWIGIRSVAERAIVLLDKYGKEVLDEVETILRMVQAVTDRDFTALFAEINKASVDIPALISKIQEEFGI